MPHPISSIVKAWNYDKNNYTSIYNHSYFKYMWTLVATSICFCPTNPSPGGT